MRVLLFGALALLPTAVGAFAQAATPTEMLVRKLGDAAPEVREQAASELRRLGQAAEAALEAGLASDDIEVRRACTDLLDALHEDRGPRVEAFLKGIDPSDKPFPGWAAFKKLAGDDRLARLGYYALHQTNPTFLEQLEKKPAQVAGRTQELATSVWNRQAPRPPGQSRAEQITVALLAAAVAGKLDQNAFNPVSTMFYQQDVRDLIANDVVVRRLATRVLTARGADDPNQLFQAAYLANHLNLTEYIESTLRPAALKMVEELGDAPKDPNRLTQVVQLVQVARLAGDLRPKLVPLVRKLAEAAVKSVEDGTAFSNPNAFYQASNACTQLGLADIADELLKPAVRKMLLSLGDKIDDTNRFYQAVNLARTFRLEEELNAFVQPAVCRLILEAAEHPEDEGRFHTALNLARMLNLNEAADAVLRPAARRRILTALEQSPDVDHFTRLVYLARTFDLGDLLEDTLKPVFVRQAAALLDRPDFQRIQQLYYLAQNFGGGNLIDDNIKPAFLKHLQATQEKALNASLVAQQLNLAKQMGYLKEVLPLARRAALAKEIQGHARGQAIFTVIEFGDKGDLATLEPLLSDSTRVGQMGLNSTVLNAEVRDVVLGGLVARSGKPLGDFGFPYFKVVPQVRPFDTSPSCLGFANAEERAAAFKKWEQSKAASPEGRP